MKNACPLWLGTYLVRLGYMQILLGSYETVIKINSKATNIEYIQHFISSCFTDVVIENNYILIPELIGNYHHRTFLLKWLYTLYAKKTNNYVPELKKVLIDRQYKAIKIVFKTKILYKITYKIVKNETILININPKNDKVVATLKDHFKIQSTALSTPLHVEIDTKSRRELLEYLIYSDDTISVPHIHIFDKKKMEEFLENKRAEETQKSFISEAYFVLGLTPNDDKKIIKKHYRLLAKKYHPDMADSKDDETIALCTKKFQNIQRAYEVLKKAI